MLAAVGPLLGLLVGMSLLFPLSMLVRGIVEVRSHSLKETFIEQLQDLTQILKWTIHSTSKVALK